MSDMELFEANEEIARLQAELADCKKERDGYKAFWAADHDSLVNANQARQDAVRELECLKVRYDLLEYNQASGAGRFTPIPPHQGRT